MQDHERRFENLAKGFAIVPLILVAVMLFMLIIAVARYWSG